MFNKSTGLCMYIDADQYTVGTKNQDCGSHYRRSGC